MEMDMPRLELRYHAQRRYHSGHYLGHHRVAWMREVINIHHLQVEANVHNAHEGRAMCLQCLMPHDYKSTRRLFNIKPYKTHQSSKEECSMWRISDRRM